MPTLNNFMPSEACTRMGTGLDSKLICGSLALLKGRGIYESNFSSFVVFNRCINLNLGYIDLI